MSAPVIIELGEDRTLPEVDRVRPPARPGLPAIVGLVAALVVLIGGSAPPADATLTEATVEAGLGDFVEAVGDRLYVAAADPLGAGDRTLSSYALPEGRLLWRAPIAVRGPIRRAIELDGVVILEVENGPRGDTVAVAAQTGRALWQRGAALLAVSPNRTLLVLGSLAAVDPEGDKLGPVDGGTVTEGVEIATGRTVWSYPVPNGYWHCVACEGLVDDPAQSIITRPDGGIEVRDLDTGRVLDSAVVLKAGAVRAPLVVGRLLLVRTERGGDDRGWDLLAYSLDTLRPLWRSPLPERGDWFVVQGCGRGSLCLLGREGGVGVLAEATGQLRWTSYDWVSMRAVGDRLVAHSRSSFGAPSHTAVLDPRTGAELHDLGRWDMIGMAGPDRITLLRRDAATGRAWFGVTDPSIGVVRTLGAVTDVSGDCHSTAGWVLCRKLNASVGIWRY